MSKVIMLNAPPLRTVGISLLSMLQYYSTTHIEGQFHFVPCIMFFTFEKATPPRTPLVSADLTTGCLAGAVDVTTAFNVPRGSPKRPEKDFRDHQSFRFKLQHLPSTTRVDQSEKGLHHCTIPIIHGLATAFTMLPSLRRRRLHYFLGMMWSPYGLIIFFISYYSSRVITSFAFRGMEVTSRFAYRKCVGQSVSVPCWSSIGDGHDKTAGGEDDRIDLVKRCLMEWFQGDFDNYPQVVEDRRNDLEPREGGGHEHFHCTLVPVSETTRLAAFFFDGNPDRIFRFRFYEILFDSPSPVGDDYAVEMRLNTLHPELEQLLRAHSADPVSWPGIFHQFEPNDRIEEKVTLLPKCEISWSLEKDPDQHSYAMDISDDSENSLHAIMVHGEATVNSTIVPGMAIRILDQLSLYPDVFYINDRGFDPLTGAFIYGNQRGVPYCLERVAQFLPHVSSDRELPMQLRRHVVNQELAWTLGPEWRTDDEYSSKLKAIGGPSAGINKKGYKSKISGARK
mmetsp:Transcript_4238/g.6685  ORF Transcript_4238/g.6685 Transcript_4238/m.6685 type:complete len:509 (+) Transcript_4238:412-1938(+)